MTRPSHALSRRMKAAQAVSASRRATLLTRSDLGAESAGATAVMSVPFNPCGEAAARRVVRVDRFDFGVGEELADAPSASPGGVRIAPAIIPCVSETHTV